MGEPTKHRRWLVVVNKDGTERRRYYDRRSEATEAAERMRKRQPDAVVTVQRGPVIATSG